MTEPTTLGASQAAIEAHYDLGNDFFRLWLDAAMVYTCALWDPNNPDESLDAAQLRKLDHLIDLAEARGAARVLDIGCGWGGLLTRLVDEAGVGAGIGLTLSPSQRADLLERAHPRLEIRLENYLDHVPEAPYDAIVSVEAIEAFARLGLSPEAKLGVYRDLFARCQAWLKPSGMVVLQAITYGTAGPEDFDPFIAAEVFPESDLPRLSELAAAWERRFEVVSIRNVRHDYTRTLKAWLRRLKARRPAAVALVGEDVVVRFERYLRLSSFMFSQGTCDLLQIALRRIETPRTANAPASRPAERHAP
jgi:cyclopropane-fatty-acyl-phospholipid synthase